MQPANRHAFKEWAVVCAALAGGRQSLLVRKGGIHEPGGRFAVERSEFWLYPTRFHQSAFEIRDEDRGLLDDVERHAPPADVVRLAHYSVIEGAIELTDESALGRLVALQVLAGPTLEARFRYRRPGLVVLPVRVFVRREPIAIPAAPHFAGCRTWVDLETDVSTDGLTPALTGAEHRERMEAIRAILRGKGCSQR